MNDWANIFLDDGEGDTPSWPKPIRCGYCGRDESILQKSAAERLKCFRVQCFDCEMAGPSMATETSAINVWNDMARRLKP